MKEEALKLADELEDEAKYGECDWTSPRVSATMIRRLVEHIEELENPIMQAIAQAFDEPKKLSDEEIEEIGEHVFGNCFLDFQVADNYLDFARAILKKAQNK